MDHFLVRERHDAFSSSSSFFPLKKFKAVCLSFVFFPFFLLSFLSLTQKSLLSRRVRELFCCCSVFSVLFLIRGWMREKR